VNHDLRDRLAHLYWLGGSPCAGKSTIAERLGKRWGIEVYHIDEAFDRHAVRFDAVKQPTLTKWTSTPWNDLWMQPQDVLLTEAIAAYTEHFALFLEDLLARPDNTPLLVEGNPIMPHLLTDLIANPRRALWLVASSDFLRATYPYRGTWVQGVVSQCAAPNLALTNWLNRDAAFAEWVGEEARRLGFQVEIVDGTRSLAQMESVAEAWFGLAHNLR